MKLEIRPRGAGKTTAAIKESGGRWSYILTATRKDAERIFRHAKKLGIKIPYPVTYNELSEASMQTGFVKELTIDDLDRILPLIFPHHRINMITMTKEPEKDK